MWIQFFLLIIGFFALIKGADCFVDGSSALAGKFKVSTVIIGLTVVAMGTSAPELAVSTSAALQGANEIALSNVIGSNIFNLLCVLGICAIIQPVPVVQVIRDIPFSTVITVLLLIMTSLPAFIHGKWLDEKINASSIYHKNLQKQQILEMSKEHGHIYEKMNAEVGEVSRITGAVLLIIFVLYIGYLIINAKRENEDDGGGDFFPVWKCVLLILFGLVLIIGGGQTVVYSAKEIARAFGMTETLIGLTIVAVGTSLPELVTSIVAAKKGETGLAVGNVIGSNIFNILFILGISSCIHPIAVNVASIYDMVILIGISSLVFFFSITGSKINRLQGFVMLLIYIADVIFAAMR